MHRPILRGRRQAGFTVIELLVGMLMLGILVAAFSALFGSTIRHSSEVEEQATLQVEARAAVDRLAQDLRQAYTGDGSAPIESIGPTEIVFLSPDRQTPFHLRRVAYRLTNGRLERAEAASTDTDGPPWSIPALGPFSVQVRSVENTTVFTFFDEAGAETADPAAVHTVGITLTVASSPERRSTYGSNVTLRVR